MHLVRHRQDRFRLTTIGSLTALFIGLMNVSPARPEGIIQQLADDGTWVRFDLEVEAFKPDGSSSGKLSGSQTVRFVGRMNVDGQPFRWLELEERFKSKNDADIVQVWKLLVAEKHLGSDMNPLDHAIAAWRRTGQEGPATRIDDLKQIKIPLNPLFFGPMDGVTSLEPRELETKAGNLKCSGHAAKHLERRDPVSAEYAYETWTHAKVPLEVVRHRCEMRVREKGRPESRKLWIFNFSESGENAKATIPETAK